MNYNHTFNILNMKSKKEIKKEIKDLTNKIDDQKSMIGHRFSKNKLDMILSWSLQRTELEKELKLLTT